MNKWTNEQINKQNKNKNKIKITLTNYFHVRKVDQNPTTTPPSATEQEKPELQFTDVGYNYENGAPPAYSVALPPATAESQTQMLAMHGVHTAVRNIDLIWWNKII